MTIDAAVQLPADETASETIPFDDACVEWKQMDETANTHQWRRGEILSKLEPKYGEHTLEKFAELNDANCDTLNDYRRVFRAWPENRGRPRFSVARDLAPHPNRYKIVEENPGLTSRRARELIQEWNAFDAEESRLADELIAKFPSYPAKKATLLNKLIVRLGFEPVELTLRS